MMHGRGALMTARDMGRLGARMRDMRAGPAAAAISTAAASGLPAASVEAAASRTRWLARAGRMTAAARMMHGRGALMTARDMGRLGARMRDMRAGPAAAAISTAAAIGIISAAAGHSTHHRARHGAGHRIPLRESPLGPRDRRDEHGEKNGRQRPPPSAWSALLVGEIVPIVWRSIQGHRAPPIKRNLYINNYSLLPGGCQCAPPNSSEVSSGEALPYRSTQAPAQRSPPDSIARVREKRRRSAGIDA